MNLDLRFESVCFDFVQFAEIGITRAGHQDLDVAELLGGLVHKAFDRLRLRDVERQCNGFTAISTDLVDDLLALLHPPGAQRDRKAVSREFDCGGRSDARRRAGNDRGSARRVWIEPGHQETSTVIGRWANPRTLLEWTRTEFASSTS